MTGFEKGDADFRAMAGDWFHGPTPFKRLLWRTATKKDAQYHVVMELRREGRGRAAIGGDTSITVRFEPLSAAAMTSGNGRSMGRYGVVVFVSPRCRLCIASIQESVNSLTKNTLGPESDFSCAPRKTTEAK